ncbi:MAG: hypothetical protein GDA46_05980 [Bdellovibrionales bacterium]|nr:hypothetical protein [Bdellovibrionales bacterium]
MKLLNKIFKSSALLLFLVSFHVSAGELHKAVKDCDYERVAELLDEGANMDISEAISTAYDQNCSDDLKYLLENEKESF